MISQYIAFIMAQAIMNECNPVALLQQLQSGDNDKRKSAESKFHTLITDNTTKHEFVVILIQLLLNNEIPFEQRNLILILLRQNLARSEPTLYESLDTNTQILIKSSLLYLLCNTNEATKLRVQCIDCINGVAELTLHNNHWGDLLPTLQQYTTNHSSDATTCELIYDLYGRLSSTCINTTENMQFYHSEYSKGLQHKSFNVRCTTAISICHTITAVEEEDYTDIQYKQIFNAYQSFAQQLINILDELNTAFVNTPTDEYHQYIDNYYQLLIEVAEDQPLYFKQYCEPLVLLLCNIGNVLIKHSDPDIKSLSTYPVEICICLVEGLSQQFRKKYHSLLHNITQLCILLMLDVDDELPDDSYYDQSNTDDVDTSNLDTAEIAIDRMCGAVGIKRYHTIIQSVINQLGTVNEWRYLHTIIRIYCATAEYCDLNDIPVKKIVSYMTPESDPSDAGRIKVIYSCIDCLGQLANDFSPELQKQYHTIIFPALLQCMHMSTQHKIQAHSTAALFNMIDECESNVVQPYVNTIIQTLLQLLNSNVTEIQIQCLTCIASIAAVCKNEFLTHYNSIMPGIKQIVQHATHKSQQTLRARAIESSTYILLQVESNDTSTSDSLELLHYLSQILTNHELSDDSTVQQYLFSGLSRLASILKHQFQPVLPVLMPLLFSIISKSDDIQYNDSTGIVDLNGSSANKTIGISSSAEDKSNTITLIVSIITDLQQLYIPYIPPTIELLLPLVQYQYSNDVQIYSMNAMPQLLRIIHESNDGNVRQHLNTIFQQIINTLITQCICESDTELIQTFVTTINECITTLDQTAIQCINDAQLHSIGQSLLKLLNESHQRVSTLDSQLDTNDEDELDDESLVEIETKKASEDELNYIVSECLGTLIKLFQYNFISTFDSLYGEIYRMLQPNSIPSTRRVAVYIIDDLIEYCDVQYTHKYLQQCIPLMIQYITDDDSGLRQCCAYGVGKCTVLHTQFYTQYTQPSLQQLSNAIQSPVARMTEYSISTDNCVLAYGRIIISQKLYQHCTTWLNYLPLQGDVNEGVNTYNILCQLVELNNDTQIITPSNLSQILLVLCQSVNTQWSDTQLNQRITVILQQLKQQLSMDQLQQVIHTIPQKHRKKIENVISSV